MPRMLETYPKNRPVCLWLFRSFGGVRVQSPVLAFECEEHRAPVGSPETLLCGLQWPRSLEEINGERERMSEPRGRAYGSTAYLPLGVVFFALAVTMLILGNVSWIAFFTMGITFLIVGLRARAGNYEPPSVPRV